jgi:hypothetical protein
MCQPPVQVFVSLSVKGRGLWLGDVPKVNVEEGESGKNSAQPRNQ